MKAAISGSTGFIGSHLTTHLESAGWQVIPLTRQDINQTENTLAQKIDGCDAIINLAGSPILTRHTDKNKKLIYESRVNTTLKISKAIQLMKEPPPVFISASAIGIYSDNKVNTETIAEYADSFIAKVCKDWEDAARKASRYTQVNIVRLGVVLDAKEGALAKMIIPFKLGLGAKISNGQQMFSWIHIHDLMNAFMFVIQANQSGVFNFTAPGFLSNEAYTKTLAKALNRPALFWIPKVALRLIYGGGAQTLTSSQAVYPERLLSQHFTYKFPVLEQAMEDLVGK